MPSTRSDSIQIDRSLSPLRWGPPSSSPDLPGGMPAPAEEANVVIKSNDSEPADMEEPAQDEVTPAHFPLSTHEQLQAMARRREAALSFKHQVSECRLALRYSVIGWTGTLDPPTTDLSTSWELPDKGHQLTRINHAQEKIPTALSNAPSIRDLDRQMDRLERKLGPFLPAANDNNLATSGNGQGLGASALGQVERVRAALLEIEPGIKSTRFIRPLLDDIEQNARAAGVLPPEDNVGWVWSLSFDDWFIWDAGEEVFVSARHGVRTDFVAA